MEWFISRVQNHTSELGKSKADELTTQAYEVISALEGGDPGGITTAQ